MLTSIRGFRGHPSHPPTTDLAVGAYTLAAVAQLVGLAGWREGLMAQGAFLLLCAGLAATVVAATTGLADYVAIPRGTPARRTATLHLAAMVCAACVFAVAAVTGYSGYEDAEVSGVSALLTFVAFAILAGGAWLGGELVFVHGLRVGHRDGPP